MKYTSPGKKVRLNWTKIVSTIPNDNHSEAHSWCQTNGTDGGFYKHYASDSYWFENSEDATLFVLRWCK